MIDTQSIFVGSSIIQYNLFYLLKRYVHASWPRPLFVYPALTYDLDIWYPYHYCTAVHLEDFSTMYQCHPTPPKCYKKIQLLLVFVMEFV